MTTSDRVINILTLTVSLVWVVNFATRFIESVSGSAAVDTAMLLVLGGYFGSKTLVKPKSNGNGGPA